MRASAILARRAAAGQAPETWCAARSGSATVFPMFFMTPIYE
ncbi:MULTISPECIES: hypothetical protein [unclassified Streptomyces]|nr:MULTISPECIES: hypothetical protein [unclassified Streptomyces]